MLQVQQSDIRQPARRKASVALAEKIRSLKAEVIEVMLYGRVIWGLSPNRFDPLREAYRGFLLRCPNEHTVTRSAPDHHMMPYHKVLERTDCDCIGTIVTR